MDRARSWIALTGFAAACAATALLGAAVTQRNKAWYRTLRKSPLNPPDRAFAPIWTGLYALMAASAYRVFRRPPSTDRSRALGLWWTQLLANAAWSPLFFGAHRPRASLADLGLLLCSLGFYVNSVRKVDRVASLMLAPYVAWSGFATFLNVEIVRRNPHLRD